MRQNFGLAGLVWMLVSWTATLPAAGLPATVAIDGDYPGGNIVVDRIEGDRVFVHQDLRDTKGDWFYWNFRVTGAENRELTFQFTKSNVIGVRGPAVSHDAGCTWRWLGSDAVRGASFAFKFGPEAHDVRFCLAYPYVESNLNALLHRHDHNPHLRVASLTQSRKGRTVECLHLGHLDGKPEHRVLITCRHHCCEMMASYSLEGLIDEVLSDTKTGRWLCQHAELLIVPFMDKDGVEDGDQGKNRKPRDHNRDYAGRSIHREVEALRTLVPRWCAGRLDFALDLHDPGIRGNQNERIYLVENGGSTTEGVRQYARLLESLRSGPLPFSAADNLPFGKGWNTERNYTGGMSFSRWASNQPGIRFAATMEIPYANVKGRPVTAESARSFGQDMARAIRMFLADETRANGTSDRVP